MKWVARTHCDSSILGRCPSTGAFGHNDDVMDEGEMVKLVVRDKVEMLEDISREESVKITEDIPDLYTYYPW